MKYRTPPITEAMVELHFDEASPDLSIGGRFYETWRERCVGREQIQVQQIQVSFGATVQMQPPLPPAPTDRLWLDDPWGVVQVGPRMLTVHMLRREQPYPGFERFRRLVHEALTTYRRLQEPRGLSQVAMRYINKLAAPRGSDGEPEGWLAVGAWLPESFNGRVAGMSVQVVVAEPSAISELHYVLRTGASSDEVLELWMDLKVVSKPGQPPTIADLDVWLQAAHDDGIISAFEGSVTDAARAAFEILEDDRA